MKKVLGLKACGFSFNLADKMKKRGNKKFVFVLVFAFAVLILSFSLVIYLNQRITGYDPKETWHDSKTSTPDTSTTTTSTTPERKETWGPGIKEEVVVETSIDKGSEEAQISTVTGSGGGIQQQLTIRDTSAVSELELKKTGEDIKAKLSDGREIDLTIMPNTASRIAMAELKTKEKSLKLEEVAEEQKLSIIYVSEANKTARVLNLFDVKYKSKTEISAENGKVIKTEKSWLAFLGKDKKSLEVEDMGLQLIKSIQDVVIAKNKRETLNLDEYFLNAKYYSVSENENIDLNLKKNKLVLVPKRDYVGTSSVTVTAYNGDEVLEASFNVVVAEKNVTIHTIQYSAVVDKKVRWEKKIKMDIGERAKINLPANSENVTLFELDINGNVISSQAILGNFADIDSKEGVNSYKVSYYTPAPSISEKITETGKEITVSSSADSENVHYTDVLAFSHISESYSVEMYRITKKGREKVELQRYDLNGNGFIDYIQWIVPSLSEQVYELVIEAISAEHLDSNRAFISNIYEEIEALDGVWSETISNMEYVRVTFRRQLDNTRDITLFPRIITGYPSIQVYEENGSEIIAQSGYLVSNQYNKISLTGLQGLQDTFDLRIVGGGSVEFDYIVDPSTVVLNSPANNAYLNNQNVVFNCSVTDTTMLSNITLYGNWTGNWHANETKEITGVLNETTFTKTISEGMYIWNCLVYNNESSFAWFANNYTFTIDTIPPSLGITSPSNTSYNTSVSSLTYTYTEINPDSCWYSVNKGVTNLSLGSCSGSFTGLSPSEGSNTWTVYMNDSAGNEDSASVTFVLDTTAPAISFTCDKNSVNIGEKITCSCSATDNIFSSPTISYTLNPDTGSVGDFVTLCSVTDNVGNTLTSQFSYTVFRIGEGVGHWIKTYVLTDELLKRGQTLMLGLNERLEVPIDSEKHYLGMIKLTGNTTTINVSSVPQQITLQSGEERKLDLTGDNVYDLYVKLNSVLKATKANLTVKLIGEDVAEIFKEKEETAMSKIIIWIAISLVVLIFAFWLIRGKWYKKIFKKRKR